MDKYFENRCSVREFSNKSVPEELIANILQGAIHAPNTGNMQWYSVIITKNKSLKYQLEKCHFNQPAAVNANLLATFCLDINRFEKWCLLRNANPGFSNFQSLITGFIDVAVFAQQFASIAELNGLGTCYLGTTTYNAPEIGNILGLPKKVIPLITLALGFRCNDMVATERLPVGAILHNETYQDYSDELINTLYKEKELRVENIKFVSDNGKQTLAQVFTDVRYPENNNKLFSDKFWDYIEKQGFPVAR